MRFIYVGVLAVSLTACWWNNAKKSTTSGGTGADGGGGSGGSSCSTCGDVALSGEPQSGLCTSSKPLFDALMGCACDPGPCGTTCYGTLCSGLAPDAACNTCMQSTCASSYAVCSKDQSQ